MRFIEKIAVGVVALLIVVFVLVAAVAVTGVNVPFVSTVLFTPTPTTVPTVTPTVTPTSTPRATPTPYPVIRQGWIEARDTCADSRTYGDLVVPGANLWRSPGVTAGRNLRHGTKIDIVIENPGWVAINLDGQRRWVQSFYVVDYDPSQTIEPATDDRADELC